MIALNGLTDDWTALELGGRSDYPLDEQAQKGGGDIVGDEFGYQPGFYKQYETGAIAGISDDYLGFRVRLGDDTTSHVFIGFDIKGVGVSGAIDFFIDVNFGNNNSTHDDIAFYNTGGALNTSPSTSGVGFESNYKTGADGDFSTYSNLSAVSATNDSYLLAGGSGASTDIDGAGDNDYFISFQVAMSSLNAAFKSITGATTDLTESTEMSFIVITSTNPNSLNQDFGGVGKDFDGDLSWEELGISSSSYTADGKSPVPEPSTYALLFGLVALGAAVVRRR